MGLSELAKATTTEKKHRFAMHQYHSPSFGQWQEWYAWYPVRIVSFNEVELTTFAVASFFVKTYKWVWLRPIIRRKVIDRLDGPGRESAGEKVYYEYTTMLDLLTYGH